MPARGNKTVGSATAGVGSSLAKGAFRQHADAGVREERGGAATAHRPQRSRSYRRRFNLGSTGGPADMQTIMMRVVLLRQSIFFT